MVVLQNQQIFNTQEIIRIMAKSKTVVVDAVMPAILLKKILWWKYGRQRDGLEEEMQHWKANSCCHIAMQECKRKEMQ